MATADLVNNSVRRGCKAVQTKFSMSWLYGSYDL